MTRKSSPPTLLSIIAIVTTFMVTSSPAYAAAGKYYLVGNFGYAGEYYSGNAALQNFSNTAGGSGYSHIPYSFELAFLFAMGDDQTAVGAGYTALVDYYIPTYTLNYTFPAATQSDFYITARHYFGDEIGHGFFLRADVGWGSESVSTNIASFSSLVVSDSGLLLNAGAGFGFGLSPHVSFNLEADYGRLFLSGGAIGSLQFKAGVAVAF